MSIITEGLHKTNTMNSALVLEGGAMRGLFTAGILDAFMERGFYFPKVVGISAGALQGLSYISRQPGRNVSVNIRFAPDKRYMGLRHLVRDGSYFNFRFMFGKLAHEYVPFNYDKFEKASETLYALLTALRGNLFLYRVKAALFPNLWGYASQAARFRFSQSR